MDKRSLGYLFLFGLLVSFLISYQIPSGHATIQTNTRTFIANNYDGYARSDNPNYISAWADISGDVSDSITSFIVGQRYSTAYDVWRTFIFFDTNILPETATITSANLSIYVTKKNVTGGDFDIVIQHGITVYPHIPIIPEDYYFEHYFGDGGSKNSSVTSISAYNNITLNTQGKSWINPSGFTKIVLRSQEDIDISAPSGEEFITIASYEAGSSQVAKLYVTYEYEGVKYNLYGAYYENGTRSGAVNVTVVPSDSPPYVVELNGSYLIEVENPITALQWNVTSGLSRHYYVDSSYEDIYIFTPEADFNPTYLYSVDLVDLIGLEKPAWLETRLMVNGSMLTVERLSASLLDTIPFALQFGSAYSFVLKSPSAEYDYGNFLAGTTETITLTITHIQFPTDTDIYYANISISGERVNSTYIQILYQDNINQTISVTFMIKERDGSLAYTTTSTSDSVTVNWYGAHNETDYVAYASVVHASYGSFTWSKSLPAPSWFVNPWDLDALGIFPFDSSQVIGLILVFCVAGVFSSLSRGYGLIITVIFGGFLAIIGWLLISAASFIIALALAILYVLGETKRREEGK